ncbi:MAG: hypothetical protein ACK5HL_03040 [Bacilli bacterium]
MNQKKPKIYTPLTNKSFNNNMENAQILNQPKEDENIVFKKDETIEVPNIENIQNKIENILNSEYSFNGIRSLITTTSGTYQKKIAKLVYDSIITVDGEIIPIEFILDIEKMQ